jgi:hypothetical protein
MKRPVKNPKDADLRKRILEQAKKKGITTVEQLVDYAVKNEPLDPAACIIYRQCCIVYAE